MPQSVYRGVDFDNPQKKAQPPNGPGINSLVAQNDDLDTDGASVAKLKAGHLGRFYPKGPSAQIVGFQGPKTIQSMDFGT